MSLLLASLIVSLLAVLAGWLATRRDPAGSPLLTLGSLFLLLALPAFMVLPKLTITVSRAAGAGDPTRFALPALGLLWLVGFVLFAFLELRGHLGLIRWKRQSVPATNRRLAVLLAECRRCLGIRKPVRLRLHPKLGSPAVTGLLRPTIYLPEQALSWGDDTLRMVLLHELGHLARHDLWTALTARLACLVHWFNPLVWSLRKHLLAQCEYACDARVIASGANPDTYAHALCDIATQTSAAQNSAPRGPALLAMAGRAPLRRRVERLIGHPRAAAPLLVGTALALTFTTTLALSVVRFSSPDPGPATYSHQEIHLRLTATPFPGG